jgi:hypothetical protein
MGVTCGDEDIDLAAGSVSVSASMGRDGIPGLPKTEAGRRVVPIVPALRRLLVAWRLRSPRTRPNDLVIATAQGGPVQERNIRRALDAAKLAAGLDATDGRLSMQSLRHSWASALATRATGDDARAVGRTRGRRLYLARLCERSARRCGRGCVRAGAGGGSGVRRVSQVLVRSGGRLVASRVSREHGAEPKRCGFDAHWRPVAARASSLTSRRSAVRSRHRPSLSQNGLRPRAAWSPTWPVVLELVLSCSEKRRGAATRDNPRK